MDLARTTHVRIILRSFASWFILIGAEIAHGILRAILLAPWVGEFRSNQIGVFTGSVIILIIAYCTIRWIGAERTSELLLVGFIWLLLTVAFEVLFGHYVIGLTWDRIIADYNVSEGGFMPFGLLLLFASPMIAAKLTSRELKK
jgi:hypothetical protein